MPLLILVLALLALPAQAERPALYLEAALGLNDGDDVANFHGKRTLGRFAVGAEWGGLFIEADHISDVQKADNGQHPLARDA